MEAERKCKHKKNDDNGELQERLENLGHHDDINAEEREHPDIGQEADPGDGDGKGADLPLPSVSQARVRVALVEIQDEYDG